MRRISAGLAGLSVAAVVEAEEPLVNDRPTVTDSAVTSAWHTSRLERGVARLEDARCDGLFPHGRYASRDALEPGSGLRPAGAEPRSGSRVARRIGE